jgi:alpha-tubulin suppressor-like RCC1 family protein
LGDGTWENKNTPVNVVGLSSGVQDIAAGEGHTCALTMGGGVKCWGDNYEGRLGDGTWEGKNTPVDVAGLGSGVQAITTGFAHTCALTTTGVKCWGANKYGQVGDGTSGEGNTKSMPVDVVGLSSGVKAIAAGGAHTCALTTAGGVKCWGSNSGGQVGHGTSGYGNISSTPVDVVGLGSGMKAIAVGGYHSCALTTGDGVKCWGENLYGQVGDGTSGWDNYIKSTPLEVVGLGSGVQGITGGGFHTCALTSTDGIKCWGGNGAGQLGDGTTEDKSTPTDVVGLGGR